MSVEDELNGTSSICSETQMVELEFIKKYEQLRELWDPKNPDYTNKYRRNASLDILLSILKKINPTATRVHVRRKINCLRSCYRKELRRHLASRKIGPDGEEIYEYIPSAWKFHSMRFVDKIERPHFNSIRDDLVQINVNEGLENSYEDQFSDQDSEDEILHHANDSLDEIPIQHTVTIPTKRKRLIKEEGEESYVGIVSHDTSDKEYEAIGANVACKLKRMNPQQRYQAELLINKVLIKGLKNSLSDDTDLTDVWTG